MDVATTHERDADCSSGSASLDVDLLSTNYLKSPWELLRRLAENAPIFWSQTQCAWLITRHVDVKAAHMDLRFSAERADMLFAMVQTVIPDVETRYPTGCRYARLQFAFFDGPEHRRVRMLMLKAFSKAVIERFRGATHSIVDELLDEAEVKGEFDFVELISQRLPCRVIQSILGVKNGDTEKFFRCATDIQTVLAGGVRTPREMEAFEHATIHLNTIFSALIEEREREPSEDLLSQLIIARDVDDRLSHDELLAICHTIIDAGSETTAHMLGNGIVEIVRRPDIQALVRNEPGAVPGVVDELLRYPGLVRAMHRVAREDFEFGGHNIRQGDLVFTMLSAANVDPEVFENPMTIDPCRHTRETMAFGIGFHHCVGHLLAKMELQEFFTRAFQRFDISVTENDLAYVSSYIFRGFKKIPVRFTPRGANVARDFS